MATPSAPAPIRPRPAVRRRVARASAIATPLVAIFVGRRSRRGTAARRRRARSSTTRCSSRRLDAGVRARRAVPRLRARRVQESARRDRRRAADSRRLAHPGRSGSSSRRAVVLCLAGFGTFELLQNGSGGGQGPTAAFLPAGHAKAMDVQVIAQQWEFTFRYPRLRWRRDAAPRAARAHAHPAPRHLARRDPFVLGLPARCEGRRQPRRRQRRLRRDEGAADASTSTAPSCAASGTATCSTPARSSTARNSPPG